MPFFALLLSGLLLPFPGGERSSPLIPALFCTRVSLKVVYDGRRREFLLGAGARTVCGEVIGADLSRVLTYQLEQLEPEVC